MQPMRAFLLMVIVGAGCKGDDGTTGAAKLDASLEKLDALRKKMCACTSRDCTRQVDDQLEKWRETSKGELAKVVAPVDKTRDNAAKTEAIEIAIRECRDKQSDKVATALAGLEERRDKACACQTADCARTVKQEYEDWAREIGETFTPDEIRRMAENIEQRIDRVDAELRACVDKLTNDGPKLAVTDVNPKTGDAEGGTYVVIKGHGFTEGGTRMAKVYFGGRAGEVIRFQSDRELIVQAPAGKPGEHVDVRVVFEPGGELKVPKGFQFLGADDAPPVPPAAP